MIHFKEITKDNYRKIIHLSVHEHQLDQVATNARSIAQAHYEETAWMRGIYHEETPVGFIMLDINHKENEYWVWRFMIDKEHQGKGYGMAALQLSKQVIKELAPHAKEIILTYVPKENDGADGFYKRAGFIDTGEKEGHEVIMKYYFPENTEE